MTYNLTVSEFYSFIPELNTGKIAPTELASLFVLAEVVCGNYCQSTLNALAVAHIYTLKCRAQEGMDGGVVKLAKSGEEQLDFRLPQKDDLAAWLNMTWYGSMIEFSLNNTSMICCI